MGKVKKAAKAEHKATRKIAAAREAWPIRLAGLVSEAADQPPMIALSAGTLVLGAVLGRPAVMRGGARMLASHLLATGIKTVLKSSIDRTRPAKAIAGGHHVGTGRGSDDTDFNSFPSGHTAGAVAVAQAAARDMPGIAVPARLAALAAGAVQLPRGKHYLSDVLAGAVIGWASEAVVSAAARRASQMWRERAAKPVLLLPAPR